MTEALNPSQALMACKAAIRKPYTEVGGYALFAITYDGCLICTDCLTTRWPEVVWDTLNGMKCGWHIARIDATCNLDGTHECSECTTEL